MKKNETFIATCSDYTYEGAGVVHCGDMVFFVPGLIVGEEAELGVTALKELWLCTYCTFNQKIRTSYRTKM